MLQTLRCCYHTYEFQMWPVISLKWHSMIMIMFSDSSIGDLGTEWVNDPVSIWGSLGFLTIRTLSHQKNHEETERCICGGKSCWVLFVNKVFVRLGKSSQWKIWYSDKFLSRRLKYLSAAFNNTRLPRFKFSSSLTSKHPFILTYINVSLYKINPKIGSSKCATFVFVILYHIS